MIHIYKHPRAFLYITFEKGEIVDKVSTDQFNDLADELQRQINNAPYGVPMGNTEFEEGNRWRGEHIGPDGLMSTNVEYLLPNNMYTNSLAPHYLRYYRNKLSPLEWFRVGLWITQTTNFELPSVEIVNKDEHYSFPEFMKAMLGDPITKRNLCKKGYMDWCPDIWTV